MARAKKVKMWLARSELGGYYLSMKKKGWDKQHAYYGHMTATREICNVFFERLFPHLELEPSERPVPVEVSIVLVKKLRKKK